MDIVLSAWHVRLAHGKAAVSSFYILYFLINVLCGTAFIQRHGDFSQEAAPCFWQLIRPKAEKSAAV